GLSLPGLIPTPNAFGVGVRSSLLGITYLIMKSLRTKLIINFIIVVVLTGTIATVVGVHLISEGIIKQAQEKVRTDLNSAREIYQHEVQHIETVVRLTAERFYIKEALLKDNLATLNSGLATIREKEGLDILTLTDNTGQVIVRARNPSVVGDDHGAYCQIIKMVLTKKKPCAGTEIISQDALMKESPELAQQAYIKILPTLHAKPTTKTEETAGMLIKASAPILDGDGNILGVLYGGNLISRNYKIVDKIKETVFQGQIYKGVDIGTATIFQDDVRISTNVKTIEGERAIGTRIAEDIGEQVLIKRKPWIGRAFVVKEWRITAYEPIKNIEGKMIGVLYVGILEEPFIEMKNKTIWLLISITIIGVIIALVIAYFLSRTISNPIQQLTTASQQLARGDFSHQATVKSNDEIGELGRSFNLMINAIRERDSQLQKQSEVLLQSAKLAAMGQLAASVAHEINNPLSVILTYEKLLQKKVEEGISDKDKESCREYLKTMLQETQRSGNIVRNLLDFARQSEPSFKTIEINNIIKEAVNLLQNQIRLGNINVELDLRPAPQIIADHSQLQQAFVNLIFNAIQAMPGRPDDRSGVPATACGTLYISTQWNETHKRLIITFSDTGMGIPPENIPQLFDPFFTTKARGVGLGLSVVYGIIKRHQGTIEVESQPGEGSTFIISLPANPEMT
ncbi:MAG: cache domain-containing protein, partial [Planctomycetota bacterium]|nr:cache domain-containing protein [Planctomycetota bacterium]MDI6787754.1 cache domain-containing protein [Planctomycetota bacterium]